MNYLHVRKSGLLFVATTKVRTILFPAFNARRPLAALRRGVTSAPVARSSSSTPLPRTPWSFSSASPASSKCVVAEHAPCRAVPPAGPPWRADALLLLPRTTAAS